jgi:diketogulonate reductase-like aldo/keto reductase
MKKKKFDSYISPLCNNKRGKKKSQTLRPRAHNLNSYCEKRNIMLITWSPLEEGKLAKPGFQVLDEMARKYGKTQAQVALNWLISQKKIIAVPKASSFEHIRENVGAVGWIMDESDFKRLEDSFWQINPLCLV